MVLPQDSQFEPAWISTLDPMPSVCCSCGMYTDNRVTVKHVRYYQQEKGESAGCAAVLLGVIVHVALGPLGWLISALMHGSADEGGTKTVKQKIKIKMAQCNLCHGVEPPEILDTQAVSTTFLFLVHPKFKHRLAEEKSKAVELARQNDVHRGNSS